MLLRLTFAMILSSTIALAESESKETLTPASFTEVLQSAVEISGARVVGIARFGALPQQLDEIPVDAFVPADWADESVCLSVVSVDGFYQSLATYKVSADWLGGILSLVYPSETPARLKEFGAKSIAPLLTKGSCETAGGQTSTVFWGEGTEQETFLLLNTSRSEETFLFFPSHPDLIDVPCKQSDATNRTAFDTVCTLPAGLSVAGPMEVGSVSFKNGEMGREVEFVVYLAPE